MHRCGRCRAKCKAKFCEPCLVSIEAGNFDIVRPDGRREAMPFSILVEAFIKFRGGSVRATSGVSPDSLVGGLNPVDSTRGRESAGTLTNGNFST